jgi:hypothetical protein
MDLPVYLLSAAYTGPGDVAASSSCAPREYCSALRVKMIRFVTFDALHTLITPRKPIHVQYSEVFSPYLGALPPDAIARSLKLGVLSSAISV